MWPRAHSSSRHFLGTDQASRQRGSFFEPATAASGDVSVGAGKSHLTLTLFRVGEQKVGHSAQRRGRI